MGNIVLLDDLTINKIAAGEVIERPASVIKEMVENSIDAGAKNITIEIKNGGISLIKITDDGCGIEEDDMEISFERHATSKIRKAEDLTYVKSMGFRGEALASIASIANVEMISKRAEDETGHRIVIEGGKIFHVYGGCNEADILGTAVEVKDAEIYSNVYGGNNNSGSVKEYSKVAIEGNAKIKNVYGGSNLAPSEATSYVYIDDGTIASVYGGSNSADIQKEGLR